MPAGDSQRRRGRYDGTIPSPLGLSAISSGFGAPPGFLNKPQVLEVVQAIGFLLVPGCVAPLQSLPYMGAE